VTIGLLIQSPMIYTRLHWEFHLVVIVIGMWMFLYIMGKCLSWPLLLKSAPRRLKKVAKPPRAHLLSHQSFSMVIGEIMPHFTLPPRAVATFSWSTSMATLLSIILGGARRGLMNHSGDFMPWCILLCEHDDGVCQCGFILYALNLAQNRSS
jgi:hypothetical protein